MAFWVVRAGAHGERESFGLENNVAVVGWERVPDLLGFSDRDKLKEFLTEKYPDEKPGRISSWTGQLWAFSRKIKIGDIVALPLKTRSVVAFGQISGDYRYESAAPDQAKHQRPVKWLNQDILRSKIDSDLRNSLGGATTVFSITRNNAEERIRAFLEGTPITVTADKENGDEGVGDAIIADVQFQAENQIVDYIGRKFVSHDLTHLVAGVLEAQGYKVRESLPGPDGGVDIVAGHGPMGFESPRLCVQVKSGDIQVDVSVLRQLQGVMKNYRADQGLIVSWGGFKSSVDKEARQLFFEIRLWDQSDLVRMIQEVYEHLPSELQAELPLKRTWVLVVEEG